MSFEEGQAVNIRECPKLPTKDTTIEELKKFAQDENFLIVKSGKSYFDVTKRPEIFEQAHDDFDIDLLTKIDQRELRQAEIMPAFNEPIDNDPMSLLFQNTSEEEEVYEEYDRKTYYLRLDQVETIRQLCFKEHADVSEMIRELLDMAIAQKSEQHGYDYRAESERNLLTKPRKPKRKNRKKK